MIQNHCVSIKQATVLFFSSFLLAACGEPQPRTSVREKGRLTVVMDEPLPGYFVFGGESYGYQYDLFKAYADHLGVELQVVRSERPSEYDAMLADGRADIVTALSDHAAEIASASAIPIYHTSYVLLAGKRKAEEEAFRADPLHPRGKSIDFFRLQEHPGVQHAARLAFPHGRSIRFVAQ